MQEEKTTIPQKPEQILRALREKKGMTQDQLSAAVLVTRQAVSRWETGETVPGTETLKLLSKVFDVSINTLLGAPQHLVCQCCGMPLDNDADISREPDGTVNEEYCKWCHPDGGYAYQDMETLVDFLVTNFSGPQWPAEAARAYYQQALPKLRYWSKK